MKKRFADSGGTVRVVVLDNVRAGVLTPNLYDAQPNPLSRDVLAHYGVVALPCHVRDPDHNGTVESGIGHTQKTPLRGLRFETIEATRAHLDHWDTRWADTRIHGTTKRQVRAMFAQENGRSRSPCRSEAFKRAFHLLSEVTGILLKDFPGGG